MRFDLGPFGGGEPASFIEDLGGDPELADVVEQGGPMEAVGVVGAQVQFASDQARVPPDPLGMAAGDPVVAAQRGHQPEDMLGRLGRGVVRQCQCRGVAAGPSRVPTPRARRDGGRPARESSDICRSAANGSRRRATGRPPMRRPSPRRRRGPAIPRPTARPGRRDLDEGSLTRPAQRRTGWRRPPPARGSPQRAEPATASFRWSSGGRNGTTCEGSPRSVVLGQHRVVAPPHEVRKDGCQSG